MDIAHTNESHKTVILHGVLNQRAIIFRFLEWASTIDCLIA